MPFYAHFCVLSYESEPKAPASPSYFKLDSDSSPFCIMQSPYMQSPWMDPTNHKARLEPRPALSGLLNPNTGPSGSADAW